MEKVIEHLGYKSLDKRTIDGRKYELLEIQLPMFKDYDFGHTKNVDSRPAIYLKMINPSTGEIHLEGVPRKEDNQWDHIESNTVISALKWRDGDNPENRWNSSTNQYEVQKAEKYVRPHVIS